MITKLNFFDLASFRAFDVVHDKVLETVSFGLVHDSRSEAETAEGHVYGVVRKHRRALLSRATFHADPTF